MDRLWSPWRYQYVTKASPSDKCIFCAKSSENRDEENLIVFRASHNFVLLNLYPYSTGHLMVAPYDHIATLEGASGPILTELMQLTRQAEMHLRKLYNPHGLNLGMNLGEAAGAGVPGHIHMHVLPRWAGDTNFMTTVSETRVMPEGLDTTYAKLKKVFEGGEA